MVRDGFSLEEREISDTNVRFGCQAVAHLSKCAHYSIQGTRFKPGKLRGVG